MPSFETWMTDLYNECDGWRSLLLKDIVLPGSHKSMSFGVEKQGDWVRENMELQERGFETFKVSSSQQMYIKEILLPFVKKWVQTQSKTILEQLHAGVRVFDLNVVLGKEEYCGFHTNMVCIDGDDLERTLELFKKFLDAHPKELLVLRFSNTIKADAERLDHAKVLFDVVRKTLGDLIVPPLFDVWNKSVGSVMTSPSRVIVMSDLRQGYEGLLGDLGTFKCVYRSPKDGWKAIERSRNAHTLACVYPKLNPLHIATHVFQDKKDLMAKAFECFKDKKLDMMLMMKVAMVLHESESLKDFVERTKDKDEFSTYLSDSGNRPTIVEHCFYDETDTAFIIDVNRKLCSRKETCEEISL